LDRHYSSLDHIYKSKYLNTISISRIIQPKTFEIALHRIKEYS
jgi:hypothetical protein